MYNSFQNQGWKYINKEIYKRNIEEIQIGKNIYWGVKKTKKILFFNISFLQVLGIKEDISSLNIKNNNYTFIQLGFLNKIDKEINNIKGLEKSFIKNMPEANLLINKDTLNIKSRFRTYINKAKKCGYITNIGLQENEYDDFYIKWKKTLNDKGISIIKYNEFINLLNYSNIKVFVGKDKDGNIKAGNICLLEGNHLIYLYGFSIRENINSGIHHLLTNEIIQWCIDNEKIYDTWGTFNEYNKKDSLLNIGIFKESFGGYKENYLGNYDLVFNKPLYVCIKLIFKLKAIQRRLFSFIKNRI